MSFIVDKIRKYENLHIFFWLIKDICWCTEFKLLGIIMIIPTLSMAIYIAYASRKIISELSHNIAVIFWITANSYWMISEFFSFDEQIVFRTITGKDLAIFPFILGIIIIASYYSFVLFKHLTRQQ